MTPPQVRTRPTGASTTATTPPDTEARETPPDAGAETPPGTGAQASGGTSTGFAQGLGRAASGLGAALPSLGQVDKRRVLWVGSLVAAGALGVLEWPVAAAVGIGSFVAEKFAKSDSTASRPATGTASGTTADTPTTGTASGPTAGAATG
jgi:hypothetical protein